MLLNTFKKAAALVKNATRYRASTSFFRAVSSASASIDSSSGSDNEAESKKPATLNFSGITFKFSGIGFPGVDPKTIVYQAYLDKFGQPLAYSKIDGKVSTIWETSRLGPEAVKFVMNLRTPRSIKINLNGQELDLDYKDFMKIQSTFTKLDIQPANGALFEEEDEEENDDENTFQVQVQGDQEALDAEDESDRESDEDTELESNDEDEAEFDEAMIPCIPNQIFNMEGPAFKSPWPPSEISLKTKLNVREVN